MLSRVDARHRIFLSLSHTFPTGTSGQGALALPRRTAGVKERQFPGIEHRLRIASLGTHLTLPAAEETVGLAIGAVGTQGLQIRDTLREQWEIRRSQGFTIARHQPKKIRAAKHEGHGGILTVRPPPETVGRGTGLTVENPQQRQHKLVKEVARCHSVSSLPSRIIQQQLVLDQVHGFGDQWIGQMIKRLGTVIRRRLELQLGEFFRQGCLDLEQLLIALHIP